ncbi:cytochrome P450 [Roridomyces roridus]|uniref:Cytochrome P450 n=1 Tax=Roridomyces roridus TaxID=1738132 RepID=A0AAD7CD33_9AGAR|nr:cytochrome P450 [Roridomyces roridus]
MPALSAPDGVIAATALALAYYIYRSRKSLPLPPGPKGWPLIGNVLDMPKSHSWKKFAQWGEIYGGIMSITLLGQPFVIINDPEIAKEILDKRGGNYADRPVLEMANMSGWNRVLSNSRYGAHSKEYRKLIGKVIGTRKNMARFNPTEEYQANMFLKRVLENPAAFEEATRKTAGAMVLHLTYGYKINEQGRDPLVDLADKALAEFSEITRPGAFLVDLMPILKYVPSWLPGAGFKRLAVKYTKSCDDLAEVPLAYVQEQMAKGQETPCYASDLLQEKDIPEERLYQIKWSAASFYGAGADTTVSVVLAYFLAAAKYPHMQAKAHAEIDAVVGKNRLPTFEDRDSLPYIEAICMELYRWLPIVPLAVPHRAMANDVYEGYFIPKNTLVIANVWKFLHDPAVYKDPFVFNPDRFMGPNPETDPTEVGLFGYGRRVCPGAHLADSSVWINVAKAVAGLDITRALGADGKEIDPVADTTDGIITRPLPFTCIVQPRTDQVVQLVAEATMEAP